MTSRTISRTPRTAVLALIVLGLVASALGVTGAVVSAAAGPDVRISEVANGGPGGTDDDFIEIANFGDATADLEGWRIYRCGPRGRRTGAAGSQVPALADVKLEPGETYVIAHQNSTITDIADQLYSSNLAPAGSGVWLEDDQRILVDAVGMYAEPRDTECGDALPNTLDNTRAQSYQRIDTTGDVTADFIKAGRTPHQPNATAPDPGVQPSDVLITELANGGAGGSADNFIELANVGDEAVDVSGWKVFRCSRVGRRQPTAVQATVPDGTVLEPGGVFVAAHTSVSLPDGVAHVRYSDGLANDGFGALIEDDDGVVRDSVGVYEPGWDSSCTQGTALPNRLDFGFDETYQRVQDSGDNSAAFVKAHRTVGEYVPEPDEIEDPDPFEFGPVRISELTHSGPEGRNDSFYELANYGDEPVSLDGWTVHRCGSSGRREATPDFDPIEDVTLAPGETFVAVRRGSPLHQTGEYDATYGTNLNDVGFGLIVYDADGSVVDTAGVFGQENSSAQRTSVEGWARRYSPCTKGMSIVNSADTDAGFSHQRFQATDQDANDFVTAPRSPGEVPDNLRAPGDYTDAELQPVDVAPDPRPHPPELVAPDAGATVDGAQVDLRATANHSTGEDVELSFHGARQLAVVDDATRAFTGVSDEAPPSRRRLPGERVVPRGSIPVGGADEPLVSESTDGFPYQRYELVVGEDPPNELEVTWSGRSVGRNELQLYVWNHPDRGWELLDAAGGLTGGELTLVGTVDTASAVRGRALDVLVQDGPSTRAAFSGEDNEPNLAFKDPAEYDFSFGFVTDTQFLSEGYRHVYAEMNRWLVTNQDARDIAYTFHTGDLIQNWAVGIHTEPRARNEFDFASEVMRLLEDADHPHGVTPGNHDGKWGRVNELYNEYFPPSRYADQPWFGDSWRPGDNQNHYDVMEIGGARFLMLYLGFFAGDEAIQWANQVLADHPDHNVIFATHEYIDVDGSLTTPDTKTWTALGQRYWEEIVAPNDNIFMVMSGHYHGVALNIKRDVGGVEGRMVVEMLADYQAYERNGRVDTGFLRLLQVDLDAKKMAVNTYSPSLDEHNAHEYATGLEYTDSDDEFTIDVDLNDTYAKRVATDLVGLQAPAATIGTQELGDGETATVSWSDLEPDTPYAWFVRARDGQGGEAVSPVRTFRTAE